VNLPKLSLLPLVGLSAFTFAVAPGKSPTFHPMVSHDSKSCFMSAMSDAGKNKFQPALAKLEALLMVDPVTVGIDRTSACGSSNQYDKDVARGLGIWHSALNDSPFVLAKDSSARPTVLIKFVKSIDNQGGDLQGMIEAEHEFKWNGSQHTSKLVGTMYVVYRTGNRNLSHDEVSEVVAHELGHLLGLTDADTTTGLMGPFVAGAPRLAPSGSELDAVQQFRQQVRDEIDHIEDQL
jgi:hypothetical protein